MPRMDYYLNGRGRVGSWLDDGYRSSSFGNVIADKPFTITITRMETQGDPTTTTQLAEQCVRIDLYSGSTQEQSLVAGLGTTHKQRVIVTGYKNHPSEDDFDVQSEDVFLYEGQFYRVVKVEPSFTDRVIAVAEVDG